MAARISYRGSTQPAYRGCRSVAGRTAELVGITTVLNSRSVCR